MNIESDILYWYQTNYVGFAGFTLLVWDHIDTFTTEVELVWKRRKSLIVYLFLLNRYLIPLGFVINLFAYLSNSLTPEHFVRYEGSMTMIGISVVAFMMFLRIRCLYQQRKRVYYCVGILFLIQTGLYAYLLTRGQPVRHPDGSPIKACTMIFDPKISGLATSSAWMPLLYDTIVFLLTLHRVLRSKSNMFGTSLRFDLQNRLFEDGLIYYCAIFAVNLVLTVMIAVAPPGLKNITAQLELLVTVMMMSRITLNLKKAGAKGLEGMHRIEEMSRAIRFATPEVHQLEPLYDGKRMTERRSPLGSTFIPREQSPESSL